MNDHDLSATDAPRYGWKTARANPSPLLRLALAWACRRRLERRVVERPVHVMAAIAG
ncbi:MAG: hypothetical protein JNK82_30215 [Myxococcaceae bacterium]|nr:hypothetical protein [Myxococcaceae bacterium]